MKSRADQITDSLGSVEARISAAAESAGRKRSDITLIAVTKTYPVSDATILQSLGVNNFGENRTRKVLKSLPKYQVLGTSKDRCRVGNYEILQAGQPLYIQ